MKIQLMVETITVMVFEELSFVAKVFFFTLLSQEYVKNHVLLLWNTVAFILVNSLFGRGKSQVSEQSEYWNCVTVSNTIVRELNWLSLGTGGEERGISVLLIKIDVYQR